jgi:non-specific serine/threonine protein kinase
LATYESVRLFIERARAVKSDFALTPSTATAVAEICRRLDGLPLAIELAVPRIKVMSPQALLKQLDRSLTLLTGGATTLPSRHRTLRDAIAWSYDLLSEKEQRLFRCLAVFVGGCTLEAAEAVFVGNDSGVSSNQTQLLDTVAALVDKSLLRHVEQEDGGSRFVMLETIREFAREKLEESGEVEALCDRHCDYFLQLAEDAEQETFGKEAALWMKRLDAEVNNLRAALEWSLTSESRAQKGLRLAGALVRYWQYRGHLSEGEQWCLQLLSKCGLDEPSVERAKALRGLARMTFDQGNSTEARPLYEKSLEMSRALGDDLSVAAALSGLGRVVMWQGEYEFSRSLYEESLALSRRLGDKYLFAHVLAMIGVIHMREQEYQAAQSRMEEAQVIQRELGYDAAIADTLIMQATVGIHLGEYEKAKTLVGEGLGIARELGVEHTIAFCLARLGMIALRQGDPHDAETFLLEGLARAQDSGIRRWSRWYLVGLAEVARLRGMVIHAAKLIGASEGVLSAASAHYEPATHDEIERIIASVRAELDEGTFTRLLAEGRAMPLEEIMAHTGSATAASAIIATEGQPPSTSDLTGREVEVLRLIAQGKSNQEIGQELVLSRRTVERHISNIYLKIGASGKVARATATAYALRHGFST